MSLLQMASNQNIAERIERRFWGSRPRSLAGKAFKTLVQVAETAFLLLLQLKEMSRDIWEAQN